MITEFAKPSPTACASSSNRRCGNPDSCSEYVPDAFAGDDAAEFVEACGGVLLVEGEARSLIAGGVSRSRSRSRSRG